MQNENGAYTQYNSENSETAAQVLTAMSALGTSISDERFVKNGKTVADSILSYYNKSQGFSHAGASGETNLMATEQCLYALVAAYRFENGKNALFDMTDVAGSGNYDGENADTEQSFGLYGKHPDVRKTNVTNENKTFDDISGNPAEKEIEALAVRGIINGKTDSSFFPDDTITRAEFAAITVRALGLPAKSGKVFDDVSGGLTGILKASARQTLTVSYTVSAIHSLIRTDCLPVKKRRLWYQERQSFAEWIQKWSFSPQETYLPNLSIT